MLKALKEQRETEGGRAAAARAGPAGGAGGRRGAPRPPGRRAGLRGGQRAPPARDLPRPRHHRHGHRRAGADRRVHRLRLGRRGRGEGRDEGDGDLARGLALRPPGRAAGVLRQPAPALHRLEGVTTSRCARRRSAAASRSPSTASPRSRRGEVHTFATEEELYEWLGYQFIPPELRENAGELEAARARELPALVEEQRPPRRPALPHDLVGGREGDDGGDGARGEGARLLLPRRHRPLALPARRAARRAARRSSTALNAAAEAVPAPARGRGEHPRERHPRRRPTRLSPGSTGSSPRSTRPSRPRPTERDPRRDGEPARRRDRPPDRAEDQQARADATSTSSGCSRRRGRDRHGARDQLAAGPARPARRGRAARRRARRPRSSSPRTRTRPRRSTTRRSGSARRGAPG